jgi:hypothetical protein
MFDFLHSRPRNFELPRRRLVCLLQKLMKKDNAPIYNRTVKDSCNTFGRLDAQFEESPSHCARVEHAKIGGQSGRRSLPEETEFLPQGDRCRR